MIAAETFVATPLVLPGWFDAAACDAWIAEGEAAPAAKAGLVVPREGYRDATVAWLDAGPGDARRERLREAVRCANRWYGFDLHGLEAGLQYIRYGPGGHSGWHADCGLGATASRKLSLSVQLSDANEYDGGDLEFLPGGRPQLAGTRGAVVAFPAFLAHRVTPLSRGTRRALVAWVHGPAFR